MITPNLDHLAKEALSDEVISEEQVKQSRIDEMWIQAFKESLESLSNEKDWMDIIFRQQGE